MITLATIWRHTIKSHGRETLHNVALTADQTMPGDRVWAIAHDASKAESTEWSQCANFSRGSKAPSLMAISSTFDQESGIVTLTHPTKDALQFDPNTDEQVFLDWVAPLMPQDRARSARILRVPDRGMTDTDYPSISLIGNASLSALSEKMTQDIAPERFRANIWLDGTRPFQEFDWIGKTLAIGDVRLEVTEPIVRCLATTANPATGQRDANTLDALQTHWGHKNFGIYARVVTGGNIAIGDTLDVL